MESGAAGTLCEGSKPDPKGNT